MNNQKHQLLKSYLTLKNLIIKSNSVHDIDIYLISFDIVKFSTLYLKATVKDLEVLPVAFKLDQYFLDRLTKIYSTDIEFEDIY